MNIIKLNELELSLIQGGDALDDYLNNPYLNPLGGGSGSPYIPPSGGPGYPPPGGNPGYPPSGGMPNFW